MAESRPPRSGTFRVGAAGSGPSWELTAVRSPAAARRAPNWRRPAAFVLMEAVTLGAGAVRREHALPALPGVRAAASASPRSPSPPIFAVYAFALIVALLTHRRAVRPGRPPAGAARLAALLARRGDGRVRGRRRGGLACSATRVLQGLGTGVATGTLSAVLLDLQPRPGMGPNGERGRRHRFGLAARRASGRGRWCSTDRRRVSWCSGCCSARPPGRGGRRWRVVPETVPYSPGWLRAVRPRLGTAGGPGDVPRRWDADRGRGLGVDRLLPLARPVPDRGASPAAIDRLIAGLPLARRSSSAGAIGSAWSTPALDPAAGPLLVGAPLFVVGPPG